MLLNLNLPKDIKVLVVEDQPILAMELELMLAEHLGKSVDLDHELLLTERVESLDEALALVRMSGVDDAERLSTM